MRLFEFSSLAVYPTGSFDLQELVVCPFTRVNQVVFTPQEHYIVILFCQVRSLCILILNVPFSITLLQIQSLPESGMAGEGCRASCLVSLTALAPNCLLLLDLALGKLAGRISWDVRFLSCPFRRWGGFAGILRWSSFSKFTFTFYWSDNRQEHWGLISLCS